MKSLLVAALILLPSTALAQDRPSILPALYVSYGTLTVLDLHSTVQGISHGAQEANPIMRGITQHTSALVAFRAGMAVTTIMATEYLWKRGHRTSAVLLMLIVNSLTAVVVVHNYQVVRG